jgi:hypothetical protein
MYSRPLIPILEGPGPSDSRGQAEFRLGLEGRQYSTWLDWHLRQPVCNLDIHTYKYIMHSAPFILMPERPGSWDFRGQAAFEVFMHI